MEKDHISIYLFWEIQKKKKNKKKDKKKKQKDTII